MKILSCESSGVKCISSVLRFALLSELVAMKWMDMYIMQQKSLKY